MSMSRLIQPRGLKSGDNTYREIPTKVEAYTASWIEITPRCRMILSIRVEAYTASWIEMDDGGA